MSAARIGRAGVSAVARTANLPLVALIGAAFLVRVLFIGSEGFHNDVAAFESWALTLRDHAPWQFYSSTGFADYPPGYFFVLLVIGRLYGVLDALHLIHGDPSWSALRAMIKLPAIAMDCVDVALVYALVSRFASRSIALAAAALLAFNPAAIYVSSYWGQIDSISWGLLLLACWLVVRAGDDPAKSTSRFVWAWLAGGFSLLIKPQGALVLVVIAAYAFATGDPEVRARRLRGTLAGAGAALLLAIVAAGVFHGSANPVDDLVWLFQRYAYGKDVYPYTSVNAFNLYAIKQPFWSDDSTPLLLPFLSTARWGIALVLGSTALIIGRMLQRRDERAFLEAAMLVAFGFFILATRMHERYIYGAFLFSIPLAALGVRYAAAAIVLSITTLLNLAYSFAYQAALEAKTPGVDPRDLWPMISHPASLVNVLVFFALGYIYIGANLPAEAGAGAAAEPGWNEQLRALGARLRSRGWFTPLEGIVRMRPLDHAIAWSMAAASFVICILWVQWPDEKIFDEIYYARAGEEYLRHVDLNGGYGVFEFTHPPLTKLLITLSMMLFGGLHGLGDTATGWRFLNVVVGALMVWLTYVFAKRLTGSTLFASLAGGMMLFDGFHFTQARIATPEITVAFFSLAVIYAFYRLTIAAQIERHAVRERKVGLLWGIAVVAVGAIIGIILGAVLANAGPKPTIGLDEEWAVWTRRVVFVYAVAAAWLVARLVVMPRVAGRRGDVTSYADGTRIYELAGRKTVETLDYGTPAFPKGREAALPLGEGAERRIAPDGTMVYATPEANARFVPGPEAAFEVDGRPARERLTWRATWTWMWILAILAGLLGASKWNGLTDVLLIWIVIPLIALQRFLQRPATWGNPFGIPLDLAVASMIVVGGFIYLVSYIPYFMPAFNEAGVRTSGHGLRDMVALQHAMYYYHANLKATHPYASSWWQWPLLQRPISYYYHDFRTGAATQSPTACCVAEILALPNPLVWWTGLVSIPLLGYLAWRERNKGYALIVGAYMIQWLPWIGSPRLSFEYHFFPNLAMIVLADAVLLQRMWGLRVAGTIPWPRYAVAAYAAATVALFWYFYPVLAGVHMTWEAWHARMWFPHWII